MNEQVARLVSLGLAFIPLPGNQTRQPFEVADLETNASNPCGELSLTLLLMPQTLENGWLQAVAPNGGEVEFQFWLSKAEEETEESS